MGALADSETQHGLWTPEGSQLSAGSTEGSLGRRDLIKKAAAAGTIAWTAPLIHGSLVSPAAAATLPSLCFKYQHNWGDFGANNLRVCYNGQTDPDQVWTEPCVESDTTTPRLAGQSPLNTPFQDRYKSNNCNPNRNCCQPRTAEGTSIDWWEGNPDGSEKIRTFPNPECVFTDPVCPAVNPGYSNGETITFHIDRTQCPGCYFADGIVAYTKTPGTCDSLSASCQNAGTSEFFNSVRFLFAASDKIFPIYFKFWIACNLNWNFDSDQYVPNSQCDIPDGEPNANPGHNLGTTITITV